ncbi:MAG TPA: YciI family protein [Stellaceae bacterium]|nr:YciI family protein [Stellaceae bacterium]
MQFVIVAKDGPGSETLARRMAARPAHMAGLRDLKAEGRIIDGGAMLGPDGAMVGSVVLCDFPDRAALDAYIATETYRREGVWQDITIYPLRRVDWAALMAPTHAE